MLAALRATVQEAIFSTLGLDATIERLGPETIVSIATRIVWETPVTDQAIAGFDLQRREPNRTMCIRRDVIPSVPRQSIVRAPAHPGMAPTRWIVDGVERLEPHLGRHIVLPYLDPWQTIPEV